jgi:hypothetical protein
MQDSGHPGAHACYNPGMDVDDDLPAAREEGLTIDEGGGPPIGSAWTLEVESEAGWSADLEHAAPLPRVGERIEFIGEDGRRHAFLVIDVVHTLQASASERPPVRAEQSSPNSIVTDRPDDDPPRALRAGLPRVVVVPAG